MSLSEKRLFLLDMDGTLYLDDRLFDGVKEFLARIRERGGRYLFLTNNSSRGVEGYIESAASGFLAGIEMARRLEGKPPVDFPRETAIGALGLYISDTTVSDFQPMNVNFGIMPPLGYRIKGGKRVKNAQLAARSLEKIDAMREDVLSDRKGE